MTAEQKKWLADNPQFSLVRERGIVALKQWTDKGFLWKDGRFSKADGKTLFWFPYDAGAVHVGRHYEVC